jgi:hypothetical protein
MTTKQVLITMRLDKPINAALFIFTALIFLALAKFVTPYMFVATVSYATMVTGLYFRRQKNIHYRLMSTSIVLDLLVVLILEISRDAVATAAAMKLPPMHQAHIFASTIAVVLYFPVLTLGRLRLKGNNSRKVLSAHKKLGIMAFIFRTLGFILMFSLLQKA